MSDLDDPTKNDAPGTNGGNGDPNPNDNPFTPVTITSQEQFDELISKRLDREKRKHERELAKFEGFDDIKAKAAKFDEYEATQGTEMEKLQREAEKAARERDDLKAKFAESERKELVRDIADELGLPKGLLKRVQGNTDEEIRADIADLMEGLPSQKKDDEPDSPKEPPSQTPRQKMTFTATGDESDDGLAVSADDILKDLPRGGAG